MEYKVGSLADMISNSSGSKRLNQSQEDEAILESSDYGKQIKFEKIQTPMHSSVIVGKNKRKKNLLLNETQVTKPKRFKQKNVHFENDEAEQVPDREAPNIDQEQRTIFVGNLSKSTTKYNLKNLFLKYGTVETVRLRSASVEDVRVPKKVAVIRGKLHPLRSSINAYVRFTTAESARKALALNGTVVRDHTLRVDLALNKDNFDHKKSIFIGNIKFTVEEDDLRKTFENCGDITNVRIVRDNVTGLGKGFGYISFKNSASVELALNLDGEELAKRPMRVSRSEVQTKSLGKKKKKLRKKASFQPKETIPLNQNLDGTGTAENIEKIHQGKQNKISGDLAHFQGERVALEKSKKKKKKVNKGELKKKAVLSKLGIIPMSKTKEAKYNKSKQN